MSTLSIRETLTGLQARHEKALIPFITCGDPDLETSRQALFTLAQNGADLLEVGVPYSDPLADGPVIQAAATRALRQGITLDRVLAMLAEVIPGLNVPVILFCYYNPVLNLGAAQFLARLQKIGIRGVVIPDLPLEEADDLLALAQQHSIEVILLVAPTSSTARMHAISARAQGFVYLVSVTGTTGVRQDLSNQIPELIKTLKTITDKPITVGFGISGPDQARKVIQWGADGVIVGSACVRILAEAPAPERLTRLGDFCRQLKDAIQVVP